MSTDTFLRSRVDASPRTAVLLGGDIVALGAFVWVGELAHGFPPMVFPARYATTLAPFVLAWFGVALVAGLYGPAATASVRRGLARTGVAWLGAVPVAHGLRVTSFGDSTAPAFVVVSVLVGGAALLVWRLLATTVVR